MRRLPLFPLPVVLLPGSALPLHVFERRYRSLMAHCLEHDQQFGVVYHDPDLHGPFLNEEDRVGTVAEIEVFHPLSDGRSLVLVRGGAKFRIREGVESDTPYYEAVVEEVIDGTSLTAEALRARRSTSIALFAQAVQAVTGEGDEAAEPKATVEASFPMAGRLRIDVAWLQALLEMTDEVDRLDRLDVVFQSALHRRGERL